MAIRDRNMLEVIPEKDMIIKPMIRSINPSVNRQFRSRSLILKDNNVRDIPLKMINNPKICEMIGNTLIGAEIVIKPKMKVMSPFIVSIHQFFIIAFMTNLKYFRLVSFAAETNIENIVSNLLYVS